MQRHASSCVAVLLARAMCGSASVSVRMYQSPPPGDALQDAVAPHGGNSGMLCPPRSCAIAAQPYQTVAGPALTLNYDFDPRRFPFQQLPVHHPSVPSMYGHALLDSLAEMAETPRTIDRGRNAALVVAPLPEFWQRVGNLNTVYCSMHRPTKGGRSGDRCAQDAASLSTMPVTHPASGSIELVGSTHRPGLLDVRASLHNNAFQPICTMLWTGSEATCTDDGASGARIGSGLTTLMTDADARQEASALQRRPLWEGDNAGQRETLAACKYVIDVRRLDGDKGLAALAYLAHDDAAVAALPKLGLAVPPWTVLDLIAEACNAAARASLLLDAAAASSSSVAHDSSTAWTLASYHATHNGDLLFDRPVEVVAAPPKYFERYSIPPWQHKVGLPMLVGSPCVVVHAEVRQDNRVVTSGVYYLTLVGKHV